MNKKNLYLLIVILLFSLATMTAYAENTHVINGVSVTYRSSAIKNNCWRYANEIYKIIWNQEFSNNRNTSDNMLRNISAESDLALNSENLKAYVSAAPIGAVIRITGKSCLFVSRDSVGHSQIIVDKDANGFTVFESNIGKSSNPYSREFSYTWESYVRSWNKDDNHRYIKYIKWPNAPTYSPSIEHPIPTDLGADFYAHIKNTGNGAYLTEQDDRNITALSPTGNSNQIWHFERLENNQYKITSAKNGYALDVDCGRPDAGANVGAVPYHDDAAQKWSFRSVNDAYTISAQCTSCVIDAGGGGGNAYMQQEFLNWCQLFTVQIIDYHPNVDSGSDFYAHIKNTGNGAYLTEQDDRNVTALSPTGNNNQIWHFERLENNQYKITSAKDGYALDVDCGRPDAGANVGAYPYHDDAAQKWGFRSVNDAYTISAQCTSCVLDAGGGGGNAYMQQEFLNWCQLFTVQIIDYHPNVDLGSDFYAHIKNTGNGAYLTEQDDRNVTALSPTGNSNQIWHFERLENNLYKITSARDGYALDVDCGRPDAGANVGAYPYHDDAAQKWHFRSVNDAYTISAQCTSCVLDAGGGGGNVYMAEDYQNWCQSFTVQKIDYHP